jgi:hypothetical protein
LDQSILNSRLDYQSLETKAQTEDLVTVFTELRSITRVGGRHGLIGIGSNEQPFNLFLPNVDSAAGQEILNLLESRYISQGDDHPRRSYAYVTGRLSTYNNRPQLVVTSSNQISDYLGTRADLTPQIAVRITSILPNPSGPDAGFERLQLTNTGREAVNIAGWLIQDRSGRGLNLEGSIEPRETRELKLQAGEMPLNNRGDEITLFDQNGKIMNAVSYSASDVVSGQSIQFS